MSKAFKIPKAQTAILLIPKANASIKIILKICLPVFARFRVFCCVGVCYVCIVLVLFCVFMP